VRVATASRDSSLRSTAPPSAARRVASVVVLAVLAGLVAPACLADLGDPSPAPAVYVFTSPLHDSVVNVGDVSDAFSCDLTRNGEPVPCLLGLTIANGDVVRVIEGPRIAVDRGRTVGTGGGGASRYGLGRVDVEARPLNVQMPADTIVRVSRLRAVAPRVYVTNVAGGEDTLSGAGAERLYLPLATTLGGEPIPFVPFTWTQESGQTVATYVPGTEGRVRALSNGVAVFRVSTDTATVRFRVRVVGAP